MYGFQRMMIIFIHLNEVICAAWTWILQAPTLLGADTGPGRRGRVSQTWESIIWLLHGVYAWLGWRLWQIYQQSCHSSPSCPGVWFDWTVTIYDSNQWAVSGPEGLVWLMCLGLIACILIPVMYLQTFCRILCFQCYTPPKLGEKDGCWI